MTSTIHNLMEQQINTYDGTLALRKECRFIKGQFYLKNKQCFFIQNKWYRINSNHIIYDYETQVWVLKTNVPFLDFGIIGYNKKLNTFLYGYFTPRIFKNIKVWDQNNIQKALDISIVDVLPFMKEGLTGVYYNTTAIGIPKEFTIKVKPRRDHAYTFPFNYNSTDLIPEFQKSFLADFRGKDLATDNYKYIEDFTFGVEFETEKGLIPEKFLRPNGLIACRDGSITGFEYVTVPLKGERGIQAIKVNCELLQKYCSCSPFESLHIHIGGYPKTVKAIASLYRLALLIQKDIYALFPYYYVDTSKFKKKSYCGPLPSLGLDKMSPNKIFEALYFNLSGGLEFSRFPITEHPMDRNNQQKWQISPRYVWLNLIPLIWGSRGTVEFRCHTPTVNSQKVINWIYIVMAILRFAKKHQALLTTNIFSELPKIDLDKIIESSYPKSISSILNEYIYARTDYYKNKNDHVGEDEIFNEEKGITTFKLISFI